MPQAACSFAESGILQIEGVSEALALSTCNRVEIYFSAASDGISCSRYASCSDGTGPSGTSDCIHRGSSSESLKNYRHKESRASDGGSGSPPVAEPCPATPSACTDNCGTSDNPHDRRMERLMMTVPNFAPRGVGFRFTEAQLFITTTAATPTEILTATMRQIRCPPFRKRFNEYIESEDKPMTYINEKHRARFELAARNVHRENYAVLSALYLLTADQRLWSCCKHHIINGCVFFENIKLNNCTERAYTLYCAAKDLTLGTKHITVSDLSDADLVPPMLFRTICNAMAIRRFGLAAIKEICHD